jgi:signal peptidase II
MRPLLFLLLAFVIIGADQVSKWYVMEHMLRPQLEAPAEPPAPETETPAATPATPEGFVNWYKTAPETVAPAEMVVIPNFNIVSVWNKGISFGMFNQTSDNGPMILVGISLAISLFFLIWLFRGPGTMQSIGIIMVIGGALGNVIDRLRFGAVFDFIDFHAFDYHWPAFNIADSGIVLGVAVLVIHSFFFEKDA